MALLSVGAVWEPCCSLRRPLPLPPPSSTPLTCPRVPAPAAPRRFFLFVSRAGFDDRKSCWPAWRACSGGPKTSQNKRLKTNLLVSPPLQDTIQKEKELLEQGPPDVSALSARAGGDVTTTAPGAAPGGATVGASVVPGGNAMLLEEGAQSHMYLDVVGACSLCCGRGRAQGRCIRRLPPRPLRTSLPMPKQHAPSRHQLGCTAPHLPMLAHPPTHASRG